MPKTESASSAPGGILIVDDEVSNLRLLSQILTRAGYQARVAKTPRLAMRSIQQHLPSLILLDVRMADTDGFEVCRELKRGERTRDIPVIFVSALTDGAAKIGGFAAGGVDFISKPFQEQEILARVRTHLSLRQMQLHLEDLVAQRTAAADQSDARFQAIFEQAAVGLAQVSPEGRFTKVNQRFCDIVGYSRHEMLSRSFQDITHPDDMDAELGHVHRLLRCESDTYTMEERYLRKDGQVVWVNLTASLVRPDDGSPRWFIFAVEDITLQRRLQTERDRILNLNPGLIAVADLDYTFRYVNPAWERLLGYSRDKLLGQPFLGFVHPEDRQRTIDEVASLAAGKESVDFVNRYLRQDGEACHISWAATPLPEEKLIYCIGSDVTRQVAAREQVAAYQERLRALASELIFAEERERTRIATDLHDGAAQSLALVRMKLAEVSQAVAGSPAVSGLNEVSQMLRQSLHQIRNVLLHLSSPSLGQIGLGAGLHDWVVANVEKKHELKVEFADTCDDLPLTKEVTVLLFRSACELLINVVKHAHAAKVSLVLSCVDDRLMITISDDGDGFHPHELLNPPAGGWTFGLFSIQERMSSLGGDMQIVSAPGRGCRATLTMPLRGITDEKSQT